MKKKGVTLLEIIVATVVLSLVMLGMSSLFFAAKANLFHSGARTSATQLGKLFLDPLQMHVRSDNWDTAANALSTGTRFCDDTANTQQPGGVCPPAAERNLNATTYTAQYDISPGAVAVDPSLRRVVVTVRWQENIP